VPSARFSVPAGAQLAPAGRCYRSETAVSTFRRFVCEEDAQDLMEYVFLCAFVALVGIVVWQNIVTALGNDYTLYNTQVQGLWESPDP
jgi:Flp pilus assembly pilin Flp